MNTSSAKTTGDRLIDAMQVATSGPKADWSHLNAKMSDLGLTNAEYDYFVTAVETTEDNNLLVDLLASGIWDRDRAMMHVMTRSYPYILKIIKGDSETVSGKPTGRVRELYSKFIYSAWTYASRANTITDAEYDEMSTYLNASYAAKALYLNTKVRSSLASMREVTEPLMENESVILPALDTIVSIWETLRKSRVNGTDRYINTAQVIEIAEIMGKSPEVGPRFIAFAAERGYFNTEVAMEYATSPSRALVEGVL